MRIQIYLGFLLLAAIPAWSQVEPSATGPPPPSEDAMRTPPPVSGETYPTTTGSEMRSNELWGGLNFQTAYDNDALEGSVPIAELTYSIKPTIALDRLTPRLHQTFTYSPGFTFYERTSSRNEVDQNASAEFQAQLSSHAALSVRDLFHRSTNVFNQSFAGVSGSTQPLTDGIIAPFATNYGNAASADVSYQFGPNGMIGGGGTSAIVNYLDPAQAGGLSNSNSRGGSAFYNLRLSSAQYVGAIYQYSKMSADSVTGDSETNTNTIFGFYTLYLKRTLSISVSAGPQHFDAINPLLHGTASWTPAATASIGWQRNRVNFAASYSRSVSGSVGLLGAFQSNFANGSARWQFARTWTVGLTASYADFRNVTPLFVGSSPGGHTISGTATIEHPIGQRFLTEVGYARLDQRYSGVEVLSAEPNNDREYISISYNFKRPLGR